MTISVAILVPEGIVLASDSRQVANSVLSGTLRTSTDSAEKIIQLSANSAAAVVGLGTYYDDANTSPVSVSKLLRSISKSLSTPCSVKETANIICQKMGEYLQKHLTITKRQQEWTMFYVAGFDLNSGIGELYRCEVPGDVKLERTTNDAGLVWNGQRDIVDRLVLGYDPRLFQFLESDGVGLREMILKQHPKLQLHFDFQTISLQDAVDLAVLLIHTTIELQRLSDGIVGAPGQFPTCGGAIDVALITPDEGFRWLRHKSLKA